MVLLPSFMIDECENKNNNPGVNRNTVPVDFFPFIGALNFQSCESKLSSRAARHFIAFPRASGPEMRVRHFSMSVRVTIV